MTTTLAPWQVPGLDLDGAGGGTAVLDPAWRSWTGPHGGLLAALLLRTAASLAPPDQRARALTAQFLAATPGDTAALSAEVLRRSGSSSVVAAHLRDAAGQVTTTAVLTSGRPRSSPTVHDAVPAPAAPPPDDLAPVHLPVELVPFGQQLDFRPVGAHPLSGGASPELLCWVRLREGGSYGPDALAVLVDVLPPALYGATTSPVPVPTVELSLVLSDAPPAEGWVLTRTATRTAEGGWCVDDVEVWDARGRLLAQCRQLRRVLGDLVLSGRASS